jgi:hypothetical protein
VLFPYRPLLFIGTIHRKCSSLITVSPSALIHLSPLLFIIFYPVTVSPASDNALSYMEHLQKEEEE